jgi:uncharacterized membrane protein
VEWLREIFSYVCGQQHNWAPGGVNLPFCQRCTGLYVGAVPALLLILGFKPKPTSRMLWLHGICMLVMIPFGYHLLAQTGEERTLTGQLFAFGLIFYLTLLPADRLPKWKALWQSNSQSYLIACVMVLLGLQVDIAWGGLHTNAALSWLGLAGLVLYGFLVLLNFALMLVFAWEFIHTRTRLSKT